MNFNNSPAKCDSVVESLMFELFLLQGMDLKDKKPKQRALGMQHFFE